MELPMSDNAYVQEKDMAAADARYQAACTEVQIAETHLATARKTLETVSSQLSMRTVCIAQIAATLMSAADKLKGVSTVKDAVNVARHIVAEAEKPYVVITNVINKEIVCTTTETITTKTTTPTQSLEGTSEKSSITTTKDSSTSLNTSSNKCPRCGSPDPARHPAMQFEGEVQICSHEFHNKKP